MIRNIIGKLLFKYFDKHLEKGFDFAYDDDRYDEWRSYGLGSFKFDIIYSYYDDWSKRQSYQGCNNIDSISKRRWYWLYSRLYFRIICEKYFRAGFSIV